MSNENTATLVAKIQADITDLKNAQSELEKLGQKGEEAGNKTSAGLSLGTKAGAALAAGVTAATAALIAFTKAGVENVSRLNDMARNAGAAVESYQALEAAFGLSGVGAEQTQNAINKLNRTIGEAQQGNDKALTAFKELGLNLKQLNTLPVDEKMAVIADAIQGFGNQADKARIASDIFGKSGVDMLKAFADGGENIRNTKKEIADLGLTISSIDAAKVDAIGDGFDRLKNAVKGSASVFTVALAPAIAQTIDDLLDMGKGQDNVGESSKGMAKIVINSVAFIMNAFSGLKRLVELIAVGIAGSFAALYYEIKASTIEFVRTIAENLNKIPGVKIDTAGLTKSINDARDEIELNNKAIASVLDEPLAGDEWLKRIKDREIAEEESAKKSVERDKKRREQMAAPKAETKEQKDKGYEEFLKDLKKREEATQEHFLYMKEAKKKFDDDQYNLQAATQEQRNAAELAKIQAHEDARKQIALTAYNAGIVDEQTYQDRINQIEQDGVNSRNAIAQAELAAKVSIAGSMFDNLATLTTSGSRKLFEAGKVASYASGLIKAYEAIMNSYAAGSKIGGPLLGAAFAATAGIAQFATLARINSIQFGTKSAGPAGGGASAGTGSAQQVQSQQAQQPQIRQVANISIIGDTFNRQSMLSLAEQMAKGAKDGVEYRFA